MSEKYAEFYLDEGGTREVILTGKDTQKFEYDYMSRRISEIRAAFLQKFGFNGEFDLKYTPTRTRASYRISAADARTAAALKKEPGWLAQFSRVKI